MWRISLLGKVALEDPLGNPVHLRTRKEWELLAMLHLAGCERRLRSELASELWPTADEQKANASLRNALSRLRSALGDDALVTDRQSVLLQIKMESDSSVGSSSKFPGDFMPGHESEWVLDRRLEMREKWVEAQLAIVHTAWDGGHREIAITRISEVCKVDPLSETAAGIQARLLKESGLSIQATQVVDRHRGKVWQALGINSSLKNESIPMPNPLTEMGEWLLSRDPRSALEFLASSADFWHGQDLTRSLGLFRRVLGQNSNDQGSVRQLVFANQLYLEWAAGELGGRYRLADQLMEQAVKDGEPRLAYKLACVGMYGRLSAGDFRGAAKTARSVFGVVQPIADNRQHGEAQLNIGIILEHTGHQSEARELKSSGAATLLEYGSAEQAAGAAHVFCHLCIEDGRLDLASRYIAHSKRYFSSSGAARGAGWSQFAEADMLYQLGELRASAEILDVIIAEGIPKVGHSLIGVATDLRGRIFADLGEFGLAAESILSASVWRERLGVTASISERQGLAPAWAKIRDRLSRSDLAQAFARARSSSSGHGASTIGA